MLGNYKIRVNNEAESKEAQELFFELGYYWNTGLGVKNLEAKFLYAKNNQITMGYCSNHFSDSGSRELTLPQLRDMVSAHRKPEQGLISGADAKLAWAKGEELEFRNQKDKWYENWTNVYDAKNGFSIQEFDDTNYEFRIKPRTITLNVEIPEIISPHVIGNTMIVNFNDHDDAVKALKILQGAICKK